MPTPPKTADIIQMEGKSHRTKTEIAERKRAEEKLLTGKVMKETPEVRASEIAHKEFTRLKRLLKSIGKDDDLYGAVINRYCILQAECLEFEQKRELMYQQMAELEMDRSKFLESNEISSYYKLQTGMQKNLISLDRQVQAKRKMLMDIEKENIMTIASSLRTIPKKPEKKRNALREALEGGC